MIITIRLRLKDRHAASLCKQARAVNCVWNYCNETQQKAVRSGRQWLHAYDLQRLTAGASKELKINAHTIQKVCSTYDRSRRSRNKAWLRFRGKRSLGWIPFNTGAVKVLCPGKVKFFGQVYETMHWRNIPLNSVIKVGSFSQNAQGNWHINMPVEIPDGIQTSSVLAPVGIDLGLKDIATLSTKEVVGNPRYNRNKGILYRDAQRARKKKLARNRAASIASSRRDYLHKASARIALAHDLIVVGDISAESLTQTRMAKSVLDAGWSTFRKMLSYKAMRHGGRYIEVNEYMTSQTCSHCGSRPDGRPRGIAGLGIREWTCGDCGTHHDRDVNAARNILRLGLETLAEGAPQEGEQPNPQTLRAPHEDASKQCRVHGGEE